jgi:purine-binding chemotaxis protein CheW
MKTNAEILKERAWLLAVDTSTEITNEGNRLHIVEFLLTPEKYGIESQLINEVLLLKELTPIPGTPSFIAGVTNVRGKIIAVVNLKTFLGLVTKGITELNKIIILQQNGMEFGIIVDAIAGTRNIVEKSLNAAPATLQGKGATYVKGITSDGLIILDGTRLLSETTLLVNQKIK